MNRLTVVILLLLTSCTAALWHGPSYKTEYLNGFYVNKDIHVVLASTEKQGYLFPISTEVEKILTLSRYISFQPTFNKFKVNHNHEVTGWLTLKLFEDNLPKKDLDILLKLGFEKKYLHDNNLYFDVRLKGKQYNLEGNLPLVKLENNYKVIVEQPESFSGTAGKIIATPIAIAFDAVVVLPASFFLATLWIMEEQ